MTTDNDLDVPALTLFHSQDANVWAVTRDDFDAEGCSIRCFATKREAVAFIEQYSAPCPSCGGTAKVIGGHHFGGNSVHHIECACGYGGDQFEEDGIVFNIVPNGNEDDYIAQYARIRDAAKKHRKDHEVGEPDKPPPIDDDDDDCPFS
jgi:hypothetical protein